MVMLEVSSYHPTDRHLSVQEVVDYATSHGWHRVSQPNNRLLVFEGLHDDSNNPIRLVLPSHDSFEDTPLRLTEAVRLLATVEERTHGEVLTDIQNERGKD
jgi:hypothetical protein